MLSASRGIVRRKTTSRSGMTGINVRIRTLAHFPIALTYRCHCEIHALTKRKYGSANRRFVCSLRRGAAISAFAPFASTRVLARRQHREGEIGRDREHVQADHQEVGAVDLGNEHV